MGLTVQTESAPTDAGTSLSEFLKYGLGSVVALAVDFGLLLFLTEIVGLHYLLAAALSFCSGLAVIYGISVTMVFAHRRLSDATTECLSFAVIGLLGLVLSQLLLWLLVSCSSLDYSVAKIPTAGLVFIFNFAARRAFLFSAP